MTMAMTTPSSPGSNQNGANANANAASGSIHVLLVEDDARLATLTAQYLETHGLTVTISTNGDDAVKVARATTFDCVLLDLMLPGKDGTEVCRDIRKHSDVPIIMVTARGEEADRVMGLEGGADDYIAKPTAPRELLARVRAQVRRARGQAGPKRAEPIEVGRVRLDPSSLSVFVDDKPIVVTAYEFALLYVLAETPGRVVSREALLEKGKGSAEDAFDRSIDVRISRLRAKLGDDPKQPRLLKSIRGAGYMLAVDEKRHDTP